MSRHSPIALRPSIATARIAAIGALAVMFAASTLVIAGANGGLDLLVPAAKVRYPGWMHGPLSPLELDLAPSGLAALMLAMCAAYLVLLATARALTRRTAIVAIVALQLLFAAAPPLLSSDVFGYVDLGRLGAVHSIDPYSPAGTPLPDDEVRDYRRWGTDLPSPYGPLFVALTYPLALLGVPGAYWGLKLILVAASLATVALVARCAERRGRDPVDAAVFVGLNPVLLLFALGGAHNDFLLTLALTGGIALAFTRRERAGAAALTAAAAVKASAALPLALLLAGAADRRRALAGVAAAAAGVAALSLAFFGTNAVHLADSLRDQQHDVALFSFPNKLGDWLGYGGITDGIRAAALVALVAGVAYLLWRTWRGYDWIAAAGWATALLLVTSAWLLPWYLVWLLPLAALADDRRLRGAALAVGAFVVYTRADLWLGMG